MKLLQHFDTFHVVKNELYAWDASYVCCCHIKGFLQNFSGSVTISKKSLKTLLHMLRELQKSSVSVSGSTIVIKGTSELHDGTKIATSLSILAEETQQNEVETIRKIVDYVDKVQKSIIVEPSIIRSYLLKVPENFQTILLKVYSNKIIFVAESETSTLKLLHGTARMDEEFLGEVRVDYSYFKKLMSSIAHLTSVEILVVSSPKTGVPYLVLRGAEAGRTFTVVLTGLAAPEQLTAEQITEKEEEVEEEKEEEREEEGGEELEDIWQLPEL